MRLPEFDYSTPGTYFLTICTKNRRQILCRIVGDGLPDVPQVQLSSFGKAVFSQIEEMQRVYDHISFDHYVIMPNHVHLLVSVNEQGTSRTPSPTNSVVASLVSSLKRLTNKVCGTDLWQRSYYDHVIRDEADFLEKWQYIDANPARWAEDELYCEAHAYSIPWVVGDADPYGCNPNKN